MPRALLRTLALALRFVLLAGVGLWPAAGPAWAGPAPAAPLPVPPAAPSATITVNTTSDEFGSGASCALREAIEAARLNAAFGGCTAGSGADLIQLSPLTYTLSIAADASPNDNADGDLDLGSPLTITVSGETNAVIQQTAGDRVMHVVSATVVGLHRVTLTGGVAALNGGGLLADTAGAHVTLLETGLISNTAGLGGGLLLDGATLTATASAFISNTANLASGGGGIFLDSGELRLVNTTLAVNRATAGPGGGLRVIGGAAHLSSVSVVSNSATTAGGGLELLAGSLTFTNTLLGDNTAPTGPDCDGSPTSGNYNLIETLTDCTVGGTTTNNVTGNPVLGPVETFFGRTPARVPQPGSPAIDAANPGGCLDHLGAALTSDQRGQFRPQDGDGAGGARCDIGAVERQPNLVTVFGPTAFEDDGTTGVGVSRSQGDGPVGVSFGTLNGTATAGSDFLAASGSVTFAAGEFGTKFITVTLVNDAAPEGDEAFTMPMTVTSGLASFNGPSTAQIALYDDEAAGMLQFAVPLVVAREGDGSAQLYVMRAHGHTGAVSVDYAIAGGGSGALAWGDGDVSPRTVVVPLAADAVVESGETITVTLSNPGGGARLLDQTTGTVIVLDDDATGATINVSTTADELNTDGDCSLREAVRAANLDLAVDACPAGAGADTIVLAAATYVLSVAGTGENAAVTGDLDLNDDVTLQGQGAAATVVSGGGLDRVFHAGASNPNVVVTLRSLTIRDGNTSANGGGVLSAGALVLLDAALTNNTGGGLAAQGPTLATGVVISGNTGNIGGGIYIGPDAAATLSTLSVYSNTATTFGGGFYAQVASLTLSHSRVAENEASDQGGGLSLHDGAAVLLGVSLTGNFIPGSATSGGGLYSNNGSLLVAGGEVSGNEAGLGGVYLSGGSAVIVAAAINGNIGGGVDGGGPLVLADSVVDGNADGGGGVGGVGVFDRAWLWRVTVSGNTNNANGGGVMVSGRTWIGHSLIFSNTAPTGGGLFADDRVDLVNVTVSGNSAAAAGGGVAATASGEARLRNVTVVNNNAPAGGGLHTASAAGQITLVNTLLAGSVTGGNCGGSGVTSGGHNRSTDGTCALGQSGDANSAPAGLGALAPNGGPTLTHALNSNSGARDTGDPGACPARDQRGFDRAPAAPCDVGAFEYAAFGPWVWMPLISR